MDNSLSTFEAIDSIFDALTWLAILVGGYLLLDAIHHDDDDPDGYA